MEEEKSLSPAEFNLISSQVHDDEADPEEVRELLEDICSRVDREEQLPPVVLRYIRDSLRAYLDDSRKSLDRSFGVKRRRGKPRADPGPRIKMATEFLRLRLKRKGHRLATMEVGRKFKKERTVIEEAWAAHKFDAFLALWSERSKNKNPWTEREISQLEKILKKNL